MVNFSENSHDQKLNFYRIDYTIYLTALSIMDAYGLISAFDAIYAAIALSTKVPDHVIISTDKKIWCYKRAKKNRFAETKSLKPKIKYALFVEVVLGLHS